MLLCVWLLLHWPICYSFYVYTKSPREIPRHVKLHLHVKIKSIVILILKILHKPALTFNYFVWPLEKRWDAIPSSLYGLCDCNGCGLFFLFVLCSLIRISRTGWHALLNFFFHTGLTFGVFAGGINQINMPFLCQIVSGHFPVFSALTNVSGQLKEWWTIL